jgi:hypothetical protein
MKKIIITFEKDGTSKVEAHGFSGKACLSATEDIERAIGKAGARESTREMELAVNTAKVLR